MQTTTSPIAFCMALTGLWITQSEAIGQIVPDDTLSTESSIMIRGVTINGVPSERIDGGATRGEMLFHSFSEFSIGEGRGGYFSNPNNVSTIFSRVTGSTSSNILGTLGVLGEADLIFLNPNGILFGPEAQLDLRGAFTATTASSILFSDSATFGTEQSALSSPLTVNIQAPVGLLFDGANTSRIVHQGNLEVEATQNINLIGGDIDIDGGRIQALSGQIELVAVTSDSQVMLNGEGDRFRLSVPTNTAMANVSVDDGVINANDSSDIGGGAINIQGNQVTFSAASQVLADTVGDQINDDVGIFIQANQLTVQDGSQLSASVSEIGTGAGSGVIIRASEFVEVLGTSNSTSSPSDVSNSDDIQSGQQSSNGQDSGGRGNRQSASQSDSSGQAGAQDNSRGQGIRGQNGQDGRGQGQGGQGQGEQGQGGQGNGQGGGQGENSNVKPSKIASDARGAGTAGALLIDTPRLTLADGGRITASATETSQGANINIEAELVEIIGTADGRQRSSGLSTQTRDEGIAGQLLVNTRQLRVQAGGEVSASTFGKNRGGSIAITASENIEVSGASSDGSLVSRISSETGRPLDTRNGGLVTGTGDGGDVTVTTNRLSVSDLGEVSVSGIGDIPNPGNAGDLVINARFIGLDSQGKITAFTESGNGGDITFNALDSLSLILKGGSGISTSGGESQTFGNGGNIVFNGDFIFAAPQSNSDITSNAFADDGGEIEILARNVLGISFRDTQTSFSDITASSEQGNPGVVNINTPEIDPIQGLIALPEEPRETEIVDNCQIAATQDAVEFFSFGQGGTPPTPGTQVSYSHAASNWISLNLSEPSHSPEITSSVPEARTAASRTSAPLFQRTTGCSSRH